MAEKKLTLKEKIAQRQQEVKQQPRTRDASAHNLKHIRFLGLVLSVIAFVIYANTLGHDFILDDSNAITENHFVKQGVQGIPDLLKTDYRAGYWTAKGTLYRPLSLVMFAVEWELWPNNPFPGHLINVLLYALTAFLLFTFLCRLLPDVSLIVPPLITLLFITHPIHTEVVANIKSRDEILSFLLALGAFHVMLNYVKKESTALLAVIVFLFFLSFMAKEGSITLIAAVPVMLYFFTNIPLAKNLLVTGAFVGGAAAYLVLRKMVLGEISDIPDVMLIDNFLIAADTAGEKTATAVMILGKYLGLLFYPHPLSIDYAFNQIPIVNWSDYRPILSLLIHSLMIAVVIWRFKKKELWVFGIAFYLITISLYSNLVITIGSGFGERFLYVPSLGFCIAVVGGIAQLLQKQVSGAQNFTELIRYNMVTILAVLLLSGVASAMTVVRNNAWSDHFTIYETDVRHAPNSARLNYWYGNEIMKEKALNAPNQQEKNRLLDDAISSYNKALEIYPDYADAFGQRGLAWYRKGNNERAETDYKRAIELQVGQWKVYNNLGVVYGEKNNLPEAMKYFRLALKVDSRFPDPYKNIASTHLIMGEVDEAIKQYNEALKYTSVRDKDIRIEIFNYLAICYDQKGDKTNQQRYQQMAEQEARM